LYAVEPAPLSEVDAWLDRFRRFWEQRLDALGTELAGAGVHVGPGRWGAHPDRPGPAPMRARPIRRRKGHDMNDVLEELAAAHRAMGKGSVPAAEAYTMELRRRYDAQIGDVWDATTSPSGCIAG
jgi:hypothetical protein